MKSPKDCYQLGDELLFVGKKYIFISLTENGCFAVLNPRKKKIEYFNNFGKEITTRVGITTESLRELSKKAGDNLTIEYGKFNVNPEKDRCYVSITNRNSFDDFNFDQEKKESRGALFLRVAKERNYIQ